MALTILKSVEETQAFGEELARGLGPGAVIALHGTLGVGKTQLVRGLARGLNYTGEVTSPTFTLVHEYLGGRLPIYHLDLYRLRDTSAALAIGVEDYLYGTGVTIIEWPECIAPLLPPETLHWELEIASLTERTIDPRNHAQPRH